MKCLCGAYANKYGQTFSTTPKHELTHLTFCIFLLGEVKLTHLAYASATARNCLRNLTQIRFWLTHSVLMTMSSLNMKNQVLNDAHLAPALSTPRCPAPSRATTRAALSTAAGGRAVPAQRHQVLDDPGAFHRRPWRLPRRRLHGVRIWPTKVVEKKSKRSFFPK